LENATVIVPAKSADELDILKKHVERNKNGSSDLLF